MFYKVRLKNFFIKCIIEVLKKISLLKMYYRSAKKI